jgi:hypothetical protein
MISKLATAVGLAALALSSYAQDYYGDAPPQPSEDQAPYYGDQAPPPPGEAQVDVSVDQASPNSTATYENFQEGLAPYGQWVNVPGYGHVWRPANVQSDWRPYYHGRWEWTDEGWLWVSEEPWGWATYHYGRWAFEPSYGWVWIPGYQWAPAWVTWRYSPDYVGWAPLGPGFSVYVTSYPAVFGWWTFVPCTRFVGFPVVSVAFAPHFVPRIFHATSPAPPRAAVFGAHAPAWGGPARPIVERRIGHAIAPVRVQPVASPTAMASASRAGVVPIYRPELRGRAAVSSPAPGRAGVAPARPGFVAPAVPNRGAAVAPAAPQNRGAATAPAAPRQGAPQPAWRGGASAPAPAARPTGAPAQSIQRQSTVRGPPTAYAPARPPPQGGFAPRPFGGFAPPRPQISSAPRPQAFSAPRPQGGAPVHQGGSGHAAAPAQHHR